MGFCLSSGCWSHTPLFGTYKDQIISSLRLHLLCPYVVDQYHMSSGSRDGCQPLFMPELELAPSSLPLDGIVCLLGHKTFPAETTFLGRRQVRATWRGCGEFAKRIGLW